MKIESSEDLCRWYVVHTNPKQEERASNNLRAWGVETLHARLRKRRFNQFTGAASHVTQPLFPRYIFAKFNACKQLSNIWFTRGVHNVVSFGGSPAPVDDDIIELLQAQVDQNGVVKMREELKCGDKVVIKGGPLRNLMGIFERELKESERVLVLLTAISYQGHLVVSRDLLERVSP
jgi:transcriptional antiterminator RfaH